MVIKKNGVPVSEYQSDFSGRHIVIAIDSSKSNTAIVVGDELGNILSDYEISGAGSDINVYQLCWDTRRALSTLFNGAKIICVGIENIITKNEQGYKGIEVHQSRAKITAVFDNLIFFFQDHHSIMPLLINNQEWKASILPPEFRKRTHKKGSQDWFRSFGSAYGNRKDDVTDAVCIYMHLVKKVPMDVYTEIQFTENTWAKYSIGLFPLSYSIPKDFKKFVIKNSDTLENNAKTIVNKLKPMQFGYCKIPVESVPIEWIYSDKLKYTSIITYPKDCKEIYMIVQREE